MILWVRHLAHLIPEERKKIADETSYQEHVHEEIMERGVPAVIQVPGSDDWPTQFITPGSRGACCGAK